MNGLSTSEIDEILAGVGDTSLAPKPREVGAYFHDNVGLFLQGALTEAFPEAKITIGQKTDQGHRLKTILATASEDKAREMEAFCKGFFICFNRRFQFT